MRNFFKKYKNPIIFLGLLLLAGSYYAWNQLQISLFPEITFPKIKIIADNGEQPVSKMSITVTRPLEEAIKRAPGVTSIRSITSRGSTEISIFLDWKADVITVQQLLESRISQIRNTLPATVQLTVERMNPAILPVMGFSLDAENKDLVDLYTLAEYTIKPYLSQISGVASVYIQGGKKKEYQVELKPGRLLQYHLTPEEVSAALLKTGFYQSLGYADNYRRLYLTLTDANFSEIQDIESVPVVSSSRPAITIKDIAKVSIEEKKEYVKINANGKESVLVNILKQPDANLIQVSSEVENKIRDLKNVLPAGVTFVPFYKQSDFVDESITSIRDALLLGLLLAMIVAILFLRSWQASLTILISIPIILSATLLIMLALHYTLNIMTIGAIAAAIGLIIDDAVVIIEQIHRSREENPDQSVFQTIRHALHFLIPAMTGASLSTIVIFIPFSLMSGVAGAYFKVLAYTMIITLICSYIVTTLILPTLYGVLDGVISTKVKPVHHEKKKSWVNFFVHRPYMSIIMIGMLITTGVIVIPLLPTGFLPEMDEGSIVLDFNSPPGTSIEETDYLLKQVDSIVVSMPETESFSRRTGTQLGFFITEPSRGDYLINLKKNRKRTTEEVIADIRSKVENRLPMLTVDFGQVIGDMLGDLMSSVQPVEIKVFGQDRDILGRLADQVTAAVERVKGTADVFNGRVIAGPEIIVTPYPEKLSVYGIDPGYLQNQLNIIMQGQVAGSVQESQRMVDIRVLFPDSYKVSINKLRKMQIQLPGGDPVLLSEVAGISVREGVAEEESENLQPIIAVTSRLENRDLGSVMKDIRQSVSKNVSFPKGYGVIYGGAYAEQQQSFRDLLTILILASLLVLMVQLVLFRDIKAAFLILFCSLLGMAGSLIALYITNTPLNVGSYTGIIMIVGIIAENAIFTFQQYRSALEEHDNYGAINYAIAARLRPKLMTALGAIFALMPLALGIGAGAQLHQPLAIAVIGGLVIALPILLIIYPSILRFTSHSSQNK